MPVVTTSSDQYDDIALPTQIDVIQGGTLKAGDTRPALIADLRDADGDALPLSGVREATFNMAAEGRRESVASGPVDILDIANGRIRYAWERGDTAKDQTYRVEIDVIYNDGTMITVPTEGYGEVTITPRATQRGRGRDRDRPTPPGQGSRSGSGSESGSGSGGSVPGGGRIQ